MPPPPPPHVPNLVTPQEDDPEKPATDAARNEALDLGSTIALLMIVCLIGAGFTYVVVNAAQKQTQVDQQQSSVVSHQCPAGYPYYNAADNKCYQQPPNPGSFCVTSVSGGWNTRVNTKSAAPCYTHWTLQEGSGWNCGFWVNGQGPSGVPPNVWNISEWRAYSDGHNSVPELEAYLADRKHIQIRCVTGRGDYPQTSLYSSNWG